MFRSRPDIKNSDSNICFWRPWSSNVAFIYVWYWLHDIDYKNHDFFKTSDELFPIGLRIELEVILDLWFWQKRLIQIKLIMHYAMVVYRNFR